MVGILDWASVAGGDGCCIWGIPPPSVCVCLSNAGMKLALSSLLDIWQIVPSQETSFLAFPGEIFFFSSFPIYIYILKSSTPRDNERLASGLHLSAFVISFIYLKEKFLQCFVS